PYGLAVIAFAWQGPLQGRFGPYANVTRFATLALLLVFNGYLVLLQRPAIAKAQYPANDPHQLLTTMQAAVGPGDHRVLLEEWQLYYAGRALGWNMFLHSNPVGEQRYTEFLSTMDYVIMREEFGWYNVYNKLEPAGFVFKTSVSFAPPASTVTDVLGIELAVPQVRYPTVHIYEKAQTGTSLTD
ncbi:MAG: hypothetical protein KJO85_10970, partial [Gammaproteobacteria bacterium]|nr:hypothetical protein [Gammaproteobacteria bacterium]